MKKICLLFLLVAAIKSMTTVAQVKSQIVPPAQTTWLTDSLKQVFRIHYPVHNVYQYTDKSGTYFCIFTESLDSIIPSKDSFHFRIRAVNLKQEASGQFSKVWDMNDYVLQKDQREYNIWFWDQYTGFEDIDKDGLIDPLIVYGTATTHGKSDGRMKCMVFYKSEKTGVRHQNSPEPAGRNTTVDKAFYKLPSSIQNAVIQRMENMVKSQEALFPTSWQKAMKSKRTYFDERNQ